MGVLRGLVEGADAAVCDEAACLACIRERKASTRPPIRKLHCKAHRARQSPHRKSLGIILVFDIVWEPMIVFVQLQQCLMLYYDIEGDDYYQPSITSSYEQNIEIWYTDEKE